jgi:hypothetical protein
MMTERITIASSSSPGVGWFFRSWICSFTYNRCCCCWFLHAQKQDNLDNILSEVRGALQQTNCGCT